MGPTTGKIARAGRKLPWSSGTYLLTDASDSHGVQLAPGLRVSWKVSKNKEEDVFWGLELV